MKYLRKIRERIPAKAPGEKAHWINKYYVWPNPELMGVKILERKKYDTEQEAKDVLNQSRNLIDAYYRQSTVDGAVERLVEGGYLKHLRPVLQKQVESKLNLIRHQKFTAGKRFGKTPLTALNYNTFQWIAHVWKNTLGPVEHRKRKHALSILCDYLVEQGWMDKNHIAEFTVKSNHKDFKPKRVIPDDHMDAILSALLSDFSTRNAGICILISWDTSTKFNTHLVWSDLDHLDLSEATKKTLADHKVDWGFQQYVTPSIHIKDGKYLPINESLVQKYFKDACNHCGFDYKLDEVINDE